MTGSLKMRRFPLFSTILLIGLVVSTLMHTGQVFSYDWHRIVQIVVLVVSGAFLVRFPQPVINGLSMLGKRNARLIGLAFSLGAISVVLADRPSFAALEWAFFLLLFLLVLAVSQEAYQYTEQFDRWMRWALAAVAAIVALKVMLVYGLALIMGGQFDSAALFYRGFTNRRFFGQIATMIIPLLAYPLLNTQGSRIRWFWWSMLAVWWALLFASATRGSFLALAVSGFVLLLLIRQRALPWLKIQLICSGLGIAIYTVLFIWVPEQLQQAVSMENRMNNLTSLSSREIIWDIALQHIAAHPWFGIGPMHFANEINPVAAHPHNAPLQLAAEWGLPAALAWIYVMTAGCWAFLKKIRLESAGGWAGIALALALLGAATHSMVDGVIVVPYTQLWLVTVIAWGVGVYLRQGVPLGLNPTSITPTMCRALIALAVGLIVWGVFPETFSLNELSSRYRVGMFPRFWVQGWFEYQ